MKVTKTLMIGLACVAVAGTASAQDDEQPPMGFFITSVGVGNGADLGGLAGADAHCQELAEAAGSTRDWAAYLSTKAEGRSPAVNARDRIGEGPWYNARGTVIADNLDVLHYDNSNFIYANALDENGNSVNSGAMNNSPNRHDILTGSNMDGTVTNAEDGTCSNWTSDDDGNAIVGHQDRHRGRTPGSSWNSVHPSRGCSQEALRGSGGDGLFYCFAID